MAISLLGNKSITLKEISANVGIDDPAYMSRLFKKVTGISWREYVNTQKHQIRRGEDVNSILNAKGM